MTRLRASSIMPRIPSLPVTASSARPAPVELSSTERYLLSLVDGTLDEDELALMTGQAPSEVAKTLDRLASAGAVVLGAEADRVSAAKPLNSWRPSVGPGTSRPSSPSNPVTHAPSERPADRSSPVSVGSPSSPSSGASPSSVSSAASPASGDGELDPAKRARIDDMFDHLDERSYYEILGVAADADKKQLKAAYYALAPEFHPDKFFRRNLGVYRHKIEAVFGRITLAHDVLTVADKRAEYDAYIAQTRMNRSTSAVLDGPAEVEAILAAVEKAAAAAAARAVKPPSIPPPRAMSAEDTLRQRREALARKLTGGRVTRPSTSTMAAVAPPPAPDPAVLARSAEAVRQHQERALREAKHAQVVQYIDSGKAALEAKDWAIAANNYRIAASLEPDDPQTQAMCASALQVVAVALADGYWKQGIYEESQERWSDAALSFSKVCAGRPNDPAAHDRVAYTTVHGGGNIRRAVEFARRAIELDPKRPDYHVTLAVAYAAAAMEHSAMSELDRALALAPKDPRVTALVHATRSKIGARVAAAAPPPARAPSGEYDMNPKTDPGRRAPVPLPVPNGIAGPSIERPTGPAVPSVAPTLISPAASAPAPPLMQKKPSGLHAFVNAVRSVLTPKDGNEK